MILTENKPKAAAATEQSRAETQMQPTDISVNKVEVNYVKHCMYPEKAFNQVNKVCVSCGLFYTCMSILLTYSGPESTASIAYSGLVILKIKPF